MQLKLQKYPRQPRTNQDFTDIKKEEARLRDSKVPAGWILRARRPAHNYHKKWELISDNLRVKTAQLAYLPWIQSIILNLQKTDQQITPQCTRSTAIRVIQIKLRPLLAVLQITELLSQFPTRHRYPLHLQILLIGREYLTVIQAMAKVLQPQLLRAPQF